MTTVYFVRHAESDRRVHDDINRPLTERGRRDRSLVSDYLDNKGVCAVIPVHINVLTTRLRNLPGVRGWISSVSTSSQNAVLRISGLMISHHFPYGNGKISITKLQQERASGKYKAEISQLCSNC